MSTSIVTIDTATIAIATGNVNTALQINGAVNDEIINIEAFQECVNRLISKHEAILGNEITEVQMVCNAFGLSLIRYSKIKSFEEVPSRMNVNSFTMKTCKVYESYSSQSLKIAINSFTNIVVDVKKVWSAFGLFLLNAKTLIAKDRVSFMFIGTKKISVCNFDGAGSVANISMFERGLCDIIEYITLAVMAKFHHIEKEIIILILQNFIHFNEIEFIQKVHNTHHIKSKMMSAMNYDVVRYTSTLLREYLQKVVQSLDIPINTKCFVYIQNEYMRNFLNVLSMSGMYQACVVDKSFLNLQIHEDEKCSFFRDILGFIFKK